MGRGAGTAMVQRPLQPSDGRPIGSVGRLRTQGASRTLSRSGSGSGSGPGPGPALSCLDGRLVLAGSTCARASRKPPPAQRRPTAVGAEPEPEPDLRWLLPSARRCHGSAGLRHAHNAAPAHHAALRLLPRAPRLGHLCVALPRRNNGAHRIVDLA